MRTGIATMPLDTGGCPRWLFERMVKLSSQIIELIVAEYGPEEFVRRIADPVWFQALGTVLAFDWNSSGLTTILTAALKQAVLNKEKQLGIFICGGKGRTSRKTPEEIIIKAEKARLKNPDSLVYHSKMVAKVDSALVQDGFQIYHHAFFFTNTGAWSIVQQGMNTQIQKARRYHWYSEGFEDLVSEPHTGIVSNVRIKTLNMVSAKSAKTRQVSLELGKSSYSSLMKDFYLLAKYSSPLHSFWEMKKGQNSLKLLSLKNKEFFSHPVLNEDFTKSKYLKKIFWYITQEKPKTYEELLSLKGVGPKTIRALALISELIYKAQPSYEDPARYSFAHGGKDGTPYPVDRRTYDKSILLLRRIVSRMKIDFSEKRKIFSSLDKGLN